MEEKPSETSKESYPLDDEYEFVILNIKPITFLVIYLVLLFIIANGAMGVYSFL